ARPGGPWLIMEAILFKRAVFLDEWPLPNGTWFSRLVRWPRPLAWVLTPHPRRIQEFPNHVLGYRLDPTPRELNIIQTSRMFGHAVVTVHEGDRPLTFADLLGPELVPEVNPSFEELLRVEALIREAAVIWSHFFQSMPDPKAD
ncbi:MAG: hypothetical protein ACREUU_13480, partial [Gammaproteobacteria bacterium]